MLDCDALSSRQRDIRLRTSGEEFFKRSDNSSRVRIVVRENCASQCQTRPEPIESRQGSFVKIHIEMHKRELSAEPIGRSREQAHMIRDAIAPLGKVALNGVQSSAPFSLFKLVFGSGKSIKGIEQVQVFAGSMEHQSGSAAQVRSDFGHVTRNLFKGFGPLEYLRTLKRSCRGMDLAARVRAGFPETRTQWMAEVRHAVMQFGDGTVGRVLKANKKRIAWHGAFSLAPAFSGDLQLSGQLK